MVPAPFPHVELESEGGHCGGAGIHTSGRSPLTPSGSGRCLCTAGGASNTQDPSLPAQLHRTAGPVPMAHADSTTSNRPGKVMRTRPRGLGRAQTDCLGRAAGTPLPGQRGARVGAYTSPRQEDQNIRRCCQSGSRLQGGGRPRTLGQGLWRVAWSPGGSRPRSTFKSSRRRRRKASCLTPPGPGLHNPAPTDSPRMGPQFA